MQLGGCIATGTASSWAQHQRVKEPATGEIAKSNKRRKGKRRGLIFIYQFFSVNVCINFTNLKIDLVLNKSLNQFDLN